MLQACAFIPWMSFRRMGSAAVRASRNSQWASTSASAASNPTRYPSRKSASSRRAESVTRGAGGVGPSVSILSLYCINSRLFHPCYSLPNLSQLTSSRPVSVQWVLIQHFIHSTIPLVALHPFIPVQLASELNTRLPYVCGQASSSLWSVSARSVNPHIRVVRSPNGKIVRQEFTDDFTQMSMIFVSERHLYIGTLKI